MTKLFIAKVTDANGPKPLVTVRAEAEGEARLFLEAAYPEAEIEGLAEPGDWTSDSDTGSKAETCGSIPVRNGSSPLTRAPEAFALRL